MTPTAPRLTASPSTLRMLRAMRQVLTRTWTQQRWSLWRTSQQRWVVGLVAWGVFMGVSGGVCVWECLCVPLVVFNHSWRLTVMAGGLLLVAVALHRSLLCVLPLRVDLTFSCPWLLLSVLSINTTTFLLLSQVAREIAIACEDLVSGTVKAVDASGVTVSYTLSDGTPVEVRRETKGLAWGSQGCCCCSGLKAVRFVGRTTRSWLSQAAASLQQHPNTVRVFYSLPTCSPNLPPFSSPQTPTNQPTT